MVPGAKSLTEVVRLDNKFISMAGREFTVNVNRMKLCLNPKSWKPRALVKPTVQQDRVVCSRKLTVTIRLRLTL